MNDHSMKYCLYVFQFGILVLLFSGCTSLRKSQTRVIGNYYYTLAEFPSNVRKLNERSAEVVLESQNLKSALYQSDSARIYSLVNVINEYDIALALPDSIIAEVEYIERYIRGYYTLIPNGFNIYNTLKGTSETVSSFFGLRPVVSTILPERSPELNSAKRKKVTQHFRSQSERFRQSLTSIKSYIDGHIIPEINDSYSGMQQNVQHLFGNDSTSVSSLDYYFQYSQYFNDLFQTVINTKRLYLSISNSLSLLLDTEREIQRMTQERNNIKKDSELLHKLVLEMQRIRLLIEETNLDNL